MKNARDIGLWGWADGNSKHIEGPMKLDKNNTTNHPCDLCGGASAVAYKLNFALSIEELQANGLIFCMKDVYLHEGCAKPTKLSEILKAWEWRKIYYS